MSEDPPFPGDRSQSSDADASGAAPPEGEAEPSFGSDDPFEDPFEDAFDDSFDGEPPGAGSASSGASVSGQLRFGWQVARMWMKDHQEASMLGAFAVGVFVGSYLRD